MNMVSFTDREIQDRITITPQMGKRNTMQLYAMIIEMSDGWERYYLRKK